MKRTRGGLVAMLGVLALACACEERPAPAQLEAWRAEAAAANTAAQEKNREAGPAWKLAVGGQVQRAETLDWKALDALATTHVRTHSPQNPTDLAATIDFRGVRVADLLDRAGAAPDADEVTFVAYDAFRSTVKTADLRRFPVTLAIESDGHPIARAAGGPIFLVFPHSEFPETRTLYPDRYWSFYVTHVVVGTEPAALRVGAKSFDAAALAALPQVWETRPVAFKVHWPSGDVILRGVRLSSLLAAAGAGAGAVVLRGKAPIQNDPEHPLRIAAADREACDPLVVMWWGADRTPLSARLGGPLAVAMPAACADRYGDRYWVTFLESVDVEAAR